MAPGGTASGTSHRGVGLRSSCHDSCLTEDHALTFVEVYHRVSHCVLWRLCYKFGTSFDAAREVCRESTRFRQARKLFQPACGRLARSARHCTPRPSRRVAKRTMEQCGLTFLGTIAFCLHTLWRIELFLLPSPVPWCFRDLLLDFSRLLWLTLHPFAPVFRCHQEIFATLKGGTCAGSRAWYFFFVFSLVFGRLCA